MDDLVLSSVAPALERSLRGGVLDEVREEPDRRLRFVFETGPGRRSLLISFDPTCPWIGRTTGRPPASIPPSPFTSTCGRGLRGGVLGSVRRTAGRCATLEFADGHRLVAELLPGGGNIVLLASDGRVLAVARLPKRARERLAPGMVYRPPDHPIGRVFVPGTSAAELEVALAGALDADEVSRRLLGVSRVTAALAVQEATGSGRILAEVFAERARGVLEDREHAVIEARSDPLRAASLGDLDPVDCRLLPWTPHGPPRPGFRLLRGEDAAATSGSYYEALHRQACQLARSSGLLALLEDELRRTRRARARVTEDLAGFADPERHRIHGEALLAGLRSARRSGDHVLVPDPYDATGERTLAVPAAAGRSLQDAAKEQFRLHRRARRGLEAAQARAHELDARRLRLETLLAQHDPTTPSTERLAGLEQAMRDAGIAVGLERPRTKRSPAEPRLTKPRLEGVRLIHASDGTEILVGRGGRENDRLTFKLAGPEDFWFHASGVPGAHVVVRNPLRAARLPRALCVEVAAVAAWYSDARAQPQADVVFTRRKYVRRSKGAPAGTVMVKRSETLRVRPGLPGNRAGES